MAGECLFLSGTACIANIMAAEKSYHTAAAMVLGERDAPFGLPEKIREEIRTAFEFGGSPTTVSPHEY